MNFQRMNRRILLIILLPILIVNCKNTPDFIDQLRIDFSNHLKKIDSSIVVASFKIVRIDSITEKLGQIIYDSVFSREKAGLEAQLNSARRDNNADSIEFIQYEIDYMKKEMDSMVSVIKDADREKKYGVIATCSYTLSKNNKSKTTYPIYYFISNEGRIMNSSMIDEFIKGSANQLR